MRFLDAQDTAFAKAERELGIILSAFASDGVDTIPFKGPALARRIYPRPGLRSFRDLDLLVRPRQRDRALAILESLGYRDAVPDLSPNRRRAYHDYNGQDILFALDRLPVEPHWAVAPRTMSADIDVNALFARSIPIDTPGMGAVPGLAPEDALLVAASHGVKEQWARLIWLVDIAHMFAAWPSLDGDAVLDRAAACGCRRMVLLATALAQDPLMATPPPCLAEAARTDPAVAALAAHVRRQLARPGTEAEAPSVFTLTGFRWRARERLSDRLRYGWRTLLTARVPHFRTVPLPEYLAFLYPLVRIGRDALTLPVWRVWLRSRA